MSRTERAGRLRSRILDALDARRTRDLVEIGGIRLPDQPAIDHAKWPTEQLDQYDRSRTMLLRALESLEEGATTSIDRSERPFTRIVSKTPRETVEAAFGFRSTTVSVAPDHGISMRATFPCESRFHYDIPLARATPLLRRLLRACVEHLDSAALQDFDIDETAARRDLRIHLARLVANGLCAERSVATLRFARGQAADHVRISNPQPGTFSFVETAWVRSDGRPIHPAVPYGTALTLRRESGANGRGVIHARIDDPSICILFGSFPDDPVSLAALVRDPALPDLVETPL